jgi:hypothetical protein
MTRRAADLEARLVEWGNEYGGGKYEFSGGGGSWLSSLIHWHGRPPQGLNAGPDWTAADDVNEAVSVLEKQSKGWAPANVLRIEYTLPGQPREAKRMKLAAMGLQMGDVRYCQHLRLAKIHVAGWLRIPFSDPMTGADAVAMLEFLTELD